MGSTTELEVRSRPVFLETKGRSTIAVTDEASVFTATPPLEAVRMMASWVMSAASLADNYVPGEDLVILSIDISRAHPHVEMKRELYTELPREHPDHDSKVGLLNVHLYGVRDAEQNL